jgi:dynactin 1
MQTPTITGPRRISSPALSSAQTTPRPTTTQKLIQSPVTALTGTPTLPKLDPLRLRRSIATTSPTRQSSLVIPETPERSPERSPDKSLLSSPEKSHLSESPVKRSPHIFRTRLPSDSLDTPRPKREAIDLRAQTREVEELTAKLRILEQKRIEDRRRIREYEASKDAESTLEKYKEKLQAKMTSMATEIRSLKSILKDTEAQLSALQASAAENAEMLEMATLDREMAEERVEVLQLELDSLKERQEELVAENELLKSENEEFIRGAGPMGADGEKSAGSLQLERQNERLKDALLRLRDVTGKRETELRDEIVAMTEEIEQLTATTGPTSSRASIALPPLHL